MSKSNIADFNAAAQKRSQKELVNVAELGGTELGHYKANVKSELMIFIYQQVRGMKQKDAASALGITQAQVSLLKNLRVSQFSIDRLFEMAFKAGFTFDLEPFSLREAKTDEGSSVTLAHQQREVE